MSETRRTAEVTFRWVDGFTATDADWDRIDQVLAARGWMALNKSTSRVLLAEADGELAGFYCLQMAPHVEPMFVQPALRGSGLAEELADRMQAFLIEVHARGYYAVADNPLVAKMCEARGMERIPSPVYVKVGD